MHNRRNCLLILLFWCAPLVWAQDRPLVTEGLLTVPRGQARLGFGVEFLQNASFPVAGLKGDLARLGVFSLRLGAGEAVEVSVQGVMQDILNVDRRSLAPLSKKLDFAGSSTSDVGDLTLAAKLRIRPEQGKAPAVGFRFGVELPNASNESGLGNDETNAFVTLLCEKKIGKARLLGNVGIAILGDPVDAGSQDDLYTYGVAAVYPVTGRCNAVADVYGRVGPGGLGTEEQSRLRLGVQVKAAGFDWDVAAFAGFRNSDPDSGLILGLSKDFKLPWRGW
jgi:hypothetical protein